MNNIKKRIISIILFVVTFFASVCFGTLTTANEGEFILANNYIYQSTNGGIYYD